MAPGLAVEVGAEDLAVILGVMSALVQGDHMVQLKPIGVLGEPAADLAVWVFGPQSESTALKAGSGHAHVFSGGYRQAGTWRCQRWLERGQPTQVSPSPNGRAD